jgi:hypothetical protein
MRFSFDDTMLSSVPVVPFTFPVVHFRCVSLSRPNNPSQPELRAEVVASLTLPLVDIHLGLWVEGELLTVLIV